MKKEIFILLMASTLGVTTTELSNAYDAFKADYASLHNNNNNKEA